MSLVLRKPVLEGLNYPSSENKSADQLHGYREADLRLCFRICKKPVFSRHGSTENVLLESKEVKCPMKYSNDPDE